MRWAEAPTGSPGAVAPERPQPDHAPRGSLAPDLPWNGGAPSGTAPSPRRGRREGIGVLLAVLLPAAFAAAAVLLVADEQGAAGPSDPQAPAALARLAERAPALGAPLRPLSARRGVAALGAEPLESLRGGIRPAPPVRISIPAAHLDAPVRPVKARGEALQVPDVGTAGWFAGGPRPGEQGRAIVIGHLDTRRGPGLFARVPDLPPGTVVSVTDRRGGVHGYRVVGGAQVSKNRFPAKYVYGPAKAPVLVLITCGGDYDPESGYEDNVLLYAQAS